MLLPSSAGISGTFSVTIPDKSNLRKKQFNLAHGLRVESFIVEKAWWQEYEVAAQTASAVRK